MKNINKRFSIASIIILITLFSTLFSCITSSGYASKYSYLPIEQQQIFVAEDFFTEMFEGDVSIAYSMFDKRIQEQITIDNLIQMRDDIIDMFGEYKGFKFFSSFSTPQKVVLNYKVQFASKEVKMQVGFEKNKPYIIEFFYEISSSVVTF